jgi:hypothetical protein
MTEKPTRVIDQILDWDRKGVILVVVWLGVSLTLTAIEFFWANSVPTGVLALFWIPVLYLGGEYLFDAWQALPFMRTWKESLPTPESVGSFNEERLVYGLVATAPPMLAILLLIFFLHHLLGIPEVS